MKAAIIGVGHWGRNHLKVYSQLKSEGKIDDVIIFDIKSSQAKRLANVFQVGFCDNLSEILKNKEIKMISIVTPSPTHYSVAKQCLLAGKDILVEKPLCLTSTESWELIDISKKMNCLLMVGHLFRFHNAVVELKKIVQRGDLGEVIQIRIERSSFGIPRKDMGVLHALAIHDVDIPCFLLDEIYPEEILAFARSYYRDYPDEIVTVMQRFKTGAVAVSTESWLNPIDGKIRKLLLIGARGAASINFLIPDTLKIFDSYISGNNENEYRIINEGARTLRVDSGEALKNEISHFVQSSLNGIPSSFNPEIGARAVEMVEISYKSLEMKKTINLAEYFNNNP